MIILRTIWLSVWLVFLPIGIGGSFYGKRNLTAPEWLKTYIYGFIFELSSFEVITLPLTFMHASLSSVMYIWVGLNLLFAINGVIRQRKDILTIRAEGVYWKGYSVITWLVVILVAFQAVYVAVNMHIDLDDSWYVGTAVSAYYSDTISLVSAETGDIVKWFSGDYVMAPFPIFWAMMARITGIHPTIIMHTLIPLFFIPLSYCIYYLLAQKFFEKDRKQIGIFMLFLCLINLFGNFSARSLSTFLMFRIWQGKSVLCNILLPIMLYMFLCMVEEKKNTYWLGLFLSVLAGTMVSSMGVFLGPVLLAVLALTDIIMNKTWKNCIRACVCVFPCVVQFAIYIFCLR